MNNIESFRVLDKKKLENDKIFLFIIAGVSITLTVLQITGWFVIVFSVIYALIYSKTLSSFVNETEEEIAEDIYNFWKNHLKMIIIFHCVLILLIVLNYQYYENIDILIGGTVLIVIQGLLYYFTVSTKKGYAKRNYSKLKKVKITTTQY